MPLLELDHVRFLSVVDNPAVGDSERYLITKRHDPDGGESGRVEGADTPTNSGDEQEQQGDGSADTGGATSGPTTTGENESDTMTDSELEEQVEEQREQINEFGDQLDEIQKALADDDALEEEPEAEPELDAETFAKAVADELRDEEEDVEVSEEFRKKVEAVQKGLESDGRKAEATQTDGEGESEGYSTTFGADAATADSGGGD